MAIDATILNELDADIGLAIRQGQQGQQAHLELMRAGVAQDGRAIGAAIATGLVQADLPGSAINSKLAYDTPRSSQDTISK